MEILELETVITANIVDKQNELFSFEAFKQVEGTNLSLPITIDFDYKEIIGEVTELVAKHGLLIAKIRLNKKYNIINKIFRIAGKIISSHKENNICIIDKFELISIGLIDKIRDIYSLELNNDIKIS